MCEIYNQKLEASSFFFSILVCLVDIFSFEIKIIIDSGHLIVIIVGFM
jgi:hypothetical protein